MVYLFLKFNFLKIALIFKLRNSSLCGAVSFCIKVWNLPGLQWDEWLLPCPAPPHRWSEQASCSHSNLLPVGSGRSGPSWMALVLSAHGMNWEKPNVVRSSHPDIYIALCFHLFHLALWNWSTNQAPQVWDLRKLAPEAGSQIMVKEGFSTSCRCAHYTASVRPPISCITVTSGWMEMVDKDFHRLNQFP